MSHQTWFNGFDLLIILQKYSSTYYDYLFRYLTLFAEESVLIIVIPWLYWCYNKKLCFRVMLLYFSSMFINQFLKDYYQTPRPFSEEFSKIPIKLYFKEDGFSFPSGHTQGAASFWLFLAYEVKSIKLAILAVLIVLGVGLSRIYFGVHFPQDVLGGLIIAILCIGLYVLILKLMGWMRGGLTPSIEITVSVLFPLFIALLFYNEITVKLMAIISGASTGYFIDKAFVGYEPNKDQRMKWMEYFVGLFIIFILKAFGKVIDVNVVTSYGLSFITGISVTFVIPCIFIVMNIKDSRVYQGTIRKRL